jgi:hypothetical protein
VHEVAAVAEGVPLRLRQLIVARRIGGAGADPHRPGRYARHQQLPLLPAVLVGRRSQPGALPAQPRRPGQTVDAHVDLRHRSRPGPGDAADGQLPGPHALALRRLDDHGPDALPAHRLAFAVAGPLPLVDIVRVLEETSEGLPGRDDLGQPLHRGDRVPAGNDEPDREAVPHRQRRAVHLVGEQRARAHGLADRQAPLEPDRRGQAGERTAVRAAEDQLAGAVQDAGAIEHVCQPGPGPLSRAHGAEPPALARYRGAEEHAPVPRALQGDGERLRRQVAQLRHAQRLRLGYQAAHRQAPGAGVEPGDREVVAQEEPVRRGDVAAQHLGRQLAVERQPAASYQASPHRAVPGPLVIGARPDPGLALWRRHLAAPDPQSGPPVPSRLLPAVIPSRAGRSMG